AHGGAGRVRLVSAVVLVVLGAAMLACAVALGLKTQGNPLGPLAIGLLGGAVSFAGVLLSAVFWVPPVVRGVQRGIAGLGPVPRLAGANTVRNPQRTAATSTALLIGVTLVVMMSTGAASARASLTNALDEHYPVDIVVKPSAPGAPATVTLPTGLASDIAAIDGVSDVLPLRSAYLQVGVPGGPATIVTRALAPADAAAVMRDPAVARALADDAILVPDAWQAVSGTVPVSPVADDRSFPADATTLHPVPVTGLTDALVTPATMDRIAPDAPQDALYVSLASGADAADVLRQVQDTLGSANFLAVGPGAMRAQYDRVIGVMLEVVVGLLGVAVLIALLGVTNTLSLSVIERRRESATLRAIGLTRGALRGTLAVEGVLIAAVGAVLGSVFGLLYGWAGAATVLGEVGGFVPAVSWRDLALVLVVALGAGLLASVLPARSAARTPPVAALAEE
ncbi:MAG TPA: FtsX-like permease family protein, partial [Cellulomonas sp.]